MNQPTVPALACLNMSLSAMFVPTRSLVRMRQHTAGLIDERGEARLGESQSRDRFVHRALNIVEHRDDALDVTDLVFAGHAQENCLTPERLRWVRLGDVALAVERIRDRHSVGWLLRCLAGVGEDQTSVAIKDRDLEHAAVESLDGGEQFFDVLRLLSCALDEAGLGEMNREWLDGLAELGFEGVLGDARIIGNRLDLLVDDDLPRLGVGPRAEHQRRHHPRAPPAPRPASPQSPDETAQTPAASPRRWVHKRTEPSPTIAKARSIVLPKSGTRRIPTTHCRQERVAAWGEGRPISCNRAKVDRREGRIRATGRRTSRVGGLWDAISPTPATSRHLRQIFTGREEWSIKEKDG